MFVFGNWKMNLDAEGTRALASALRTSLRGRSKSVQVAVFPPFPFLALVAEELEGSGVVLGAQNCWHQERGAFTGEVSPSQLRSVGASWVLVGHSERRHVIGEDDDLIREKLRAALAAGLSVVLCVGETLAQRDAGSAETVVRSQVEHAFAGLTSADLQRTLIAYEPVWAIGTGRTATPDQAVAMHAVVREALATRFGEDAARGAAVLYGGSVNADSAPGLMSSDGISGALVGGASLEAQSFAAIVGAAAS